MPTSIRFRRFTAALALLAEALSACGGEVLVERGDSAGDPDGGSDDAPWPIIVWQPTESDGAAQPEAAVAQVTPSASPLPCLERPVAPGCTAADPPRFSGSDLISLWQGCGGTSGTNAQCGVLSVSFDMDGCSKVELPGQSPDAAAVQCMQEQLSGSRFVCSARSSLFLNHACN
jgi:hypothetical protein